MALPWASSGNVNKQTHKAHMATDTPDARMPPAASRYCYCVCDKKRRKHPGVRLQLFPKDARSAISISGDWARCGSRGGQLYHYYRKYGTKVIVLDTDVGVLPKPQYQSQPPTT
ncbi:hypothetical protein GWK47_038583 [Chionoecetes opilio]|uniref:Uncharacterized protein n=1 Tax=Chionoecetes opilio TaxID=41210 RepID=A0A8J4YMS5_CHIOP|nr:hypothetical protein GWK47_038583 [Chionoecetes opilio]